MAEDKRQITGKEAVTVLLIADRSRAEMEAEKQWVDSLSVLGKNCQYRVPDPMKILFTNKGKVTFSDRIVKYYSNCKEKL